MGESIKYKYTIRMKINKNTTINSAYNNPPEYLWLFFYERLRINGKRYLI